MYFDREGKHFDREIVVEAVLIYTEVQSRECTNCLEYSFPVFPTADLSS